MTVPQLKPSPVHEASLRQALQRVEDRLRQQEQKRKRDAHHERTLKLAREFASQGVRQRQLEWERQSRKKNIPQPPHQDQVTEGVSETASNDAGAQIAKLAPVPEPSKQATSGMSDKTYPADTDQGGLNRPREKQKPAPGGSKIIPLAEPEQSPHTSETSPGAAPQPAQLDTAPHPAANKRARRHHLSILMPMVAWLILFSGIIGAVLSWTTLADVQASALQTNNSPPGLPMGLLLGFAYLATGVMGFAFFWVSAFIGNQLKEIRRLLFLQSIMNSQPDQNQP